MENITTEQLDKKTESQLDQDIQFKKIISENLDEWQNFNGFEYFMFIKWLVKNNQMDWVKKLRDFTESKNTQQGLVNNPILGWVRPEEIKSAGVAERPGMGGEKYWVITNIEAFNNYCEFKKQNDKIDRRKSLVEEKKQEYEQEHEEYFERLTQFEENGQF